VKERILKLLKTEGSQYLSGQLISEKIDVSRASIWKHIKQLKEEGYIIEASSKIGYRLISCPDLLTAKEIKEFLNTKYIGNKIFHYDSINSTNNKAKELALLGEKEGSVIIAEDQSFGRGRMGRNWVSTKYKGIWMSIIIRPIIVPERMAILTQIAAAAVGKTLENLGLKPSIKWPNDIYINSKKVCGILTEMSGEFNQIDDVVIGIGINVNQDAEDFNEELKKAATSLKIEMNRVISRKEVTANLLFNFENLYNEFVLQDNAKTSICFCRENSLLLGKEIQLIKRGELLQVKALDINEDGNLLVEYSDGKIDKLLSGEVSMNGISNLF